MTEPAGPAIRIFLLDDHAVVREGLRLLLERQPDFVVVGEAGDVAQAVAADVVADVIIADLMLGGVRGTHVVAQLRERFPSSKIVVLTMVDQPGEVRAAISAGAAGYVAKEAAARELVEAVRRVASGETYLQPSLGIEVVRPRPGTARRDPGVLSERERDVLRLIALGHTNAEIASMLGVALRTVESHRAHLVDKLGLRTRAELVRYATDEGLLGD